MPINFTKGNMYDFITGTWNTVKGICSHDCSYCYMKRWGTLKEIHLDESEFKTFLGVDNFFFVGSSNDMFAKDVKPEWIKKTLEYCRKFDNTYLFQTKDPENLLFYLDYLPKKSIIGTTIESNRHYPDIMKNAPTPINRAVAMSKINLPKYLTIEPILDFDLDELINLIERVNPELIIVGADTGNHKLPEPSKEKIVDLLAYFWQANIKGNRKRNLERLLKD